MDKNAGPEETQAVQTSLQSMTITEDNSPEIRKKQKCIKVFRFYLCVNFVLCSINFSVDIFLKPIANAPIMKKQKWSVDSSKPISWILWFIAKYIKLETQEKLFLYVNQAFAPAPTKY
ncbi:hypothetical protein HHI36_009600 [Cryptolaemus montrouzieri]|uniref:Ubiquitin-like protein ATG12 n=1 Tax=Cryptolaemus montrouzieri TaxID=559131 RepID=A0ABD2MGH0_9CUCU